MLDLFAFAPEAPTPMIGSIIGAIVALAIALVGWGARLESKTNVNQQRHDDLLKLIDAKLDVFMVRFESIDARLERVERYVLNGSYKKES